MPAVTCPRFERDALLQRYRGVIRTHPCLDRTLVSFQANRHVRGARWLKYKEAFSAALAEDMVNLYSREGDTVLDPFAGIGTAVFTARALGRRGIGIELLPVGMFAMETRLSAEAIDPTVFRTLVDAASGMDWAARFDAGFALRHIPITQGAFPQDTERALAGYRAYCEQCLDNPHVRRLFHLACLGVLESVSYTRKDGQYLRWDCRTERPGVRSQFRKARIEPFAEAVGRQLDQLCRDVEKTATAGGNVPPLDLRRGSCLEILPTLPDGSVGLVLTSPPYCNRYDYTRTYALELVYLGLGDEEVKGLRQTMLSCTVENAAKVDAMAAAYEQRGCTAAFDRVRLVHEGQAALQEVLDVLERRGRAGDLNNANIPRMVRNYFLEMCFVVHELARVLKPGGRVVMVNDNVRYAGEEVPVDLILSDFAAGHGLAVEHVWKLARGKGNSSQQMGAHGRRELRKCVYVWTKEIRP